ncbi:MAG TPA: helix-turn-helix domain-containing protein [Terracidiphilus sp.]
MKQKSQAVSKTAAQPPEAADPRVARTRTVIDQAFVQLLFQRSFRSLTVSDITRKAGVGRATFYAHYPSKDALLASQFSRMIVPLLRPRPGTAYLLDCTALFDHVRSSPKLFRNIMSGGEGSGARVIRAGLEDHVQALLMGDADLPEGLAKRFLVSTILTIVSHGLQPRSDQSAQDMQRQYEMLAGSGLGVG